MEISTGNSIASEAGPTTGNFNVSRTGSTDAALTVNYTVGGTATTGTDYTALAGSVTIPAGAAWARIDVTPIDDVLVEGDETIVVTLSASASGAYIVGHPDHATVTITDNDQTFTKLGVFRGGNWFLDLNGNGAWDGCILGWGMAWDLPVAGRW